jgi:hypothetical protein
VPVEELLSRLKSFEIVRAVQFSHSDEAPVLADDVDTIIDHPQLPVDGQLASDNNVQDSTAAKADRVALTLSRQLEHAHCHLRGAGPLLWR